MSVTTMASVADLKRIRRLALGAQGLLKSTPYGRGLPAVASAIQHLGYVQLDSISVIQRAHHHVLHSRVPNYKPEMLDRLLLDRTIFEYWSHAAAFLPIEDYRYSLPYKRAIKSGQTHWYKNPDKKLMNSLLTQIKSEGPLRSRDLENKTKKTAGWWDWKPAKKALEQLYMQGDLMVAERQGFQKVYDLTERVLPSNINTTMPTLEEFASHLVTQQINCHGLVSLKGVTYLRRNPALKTAVKKIVEQQLQNSRLEQLALKNGDIFIVAAGALEKPLARLTKQVKILSPFDNFAIQRDRLSSLFKFDYQIECYVPKDKRRYGYFCLPILFQDKLVGRMDCKAHRQDYKLEIKSLHIEDSRLDLDSFLPAFKAAINKFVRFQGCQEFSLKQVTPKKLKPIINEALTPVK